MLAYALDLLASALLDLTLARLTQDAAGARRAKARVVLARQGIRTASVALSGSETASLPVLAVAVTFDLSVEETETGAYAVLAVAVTA
jgi:hypothetical protein